MAKMIIGSARHDENGKYAHGVAGDGTQQQVDDYKGECSLQEFYVHKHGWIAAIPVDEEHRRKLAERMKALCNNSHIGYDQNQRLGIIKHGIDTDIDTECDCSSGVRQCIIEAMDCDPGNFTTATEKAALEQMGGFNFVNYEKGMKLPAGTILISKKKGHTAIVVEVKEDVVHDTTKYYKAYLGKGKSIVSALQDVGEKDTSYSNRKKIAKANGINGYEGTAKQNLYMVDLIKAGKLKKADA